MLSYGDWDSDCKMQARKCSEVGEKRIIELFLLEISGANERIQEGRDCESSSSRRSELVCWFAKDNCRVLCLLT